MNSGKKQLEIMTSPVQTVNQLRAQRKLPGLGQVTYIRLDDSWVATVSCKDQMLSIERETKAKALYKLSCEILKFYNYKEGDEKVHRSPKTRLFAEGGTYKLRIEIEEEELMYYLTITHKGESKEYEGVQNWRANVETMINDVIDIHLKIVDNHS